MGLIRFYLALSVVTFHASILLRKEFKLLWNKHLFLGMDGLHAVFLFYVISGFLISFVLERKYPPGRTSAFYQAFFLAGHFSREICKLRPELLSYGFWLVIPASLCIYNMPLIPFDSVHFYFGALLFALALPSIFETTKDNRISNFFGDLTYPIYLIHIFCIVAVAGLLRTPSGSAFLDYVRQIPSTSVQSYAWMLPFLAACTVMAAIVHYLVEIPLVGFLRLAFSGLRKLGMSVAKRAA